MRPSDTELAMLKKLCLYMGKDENEICDTELYQEFVKAGGWDWPGMLRFLVEGEFVFGLAEDPYTAEIYRVSSTVLNVVRAEESMKANATPPQEGPTIEEWTEWRAVSEWKAELGKKLPNGSRKPMPASSWNRFRDRVTHEKDKHQIRFRRAEFEEARKKVQKRTT